MARYGRYRGRRRTQRRSYRHRSRVGKAIRTVKRRAFRNAVKRVMTQNEELKFFDLDITTSSSSGFTAHLLNPGGAGTTANEFTGRKYRIKRIIVRGVATAGDTIGPPIGNLLDIWLTFNEDRYPNWDTDVLVKRRNGPTIHTDLPETPGGLEASGIRVLKRWKITIQPPNNALGQASAGLAYTAKPVPFYYDSGIRRFRETVMQLNSLTNIEFGGVMLYHRSDSTLAPHPSLNMNCRLYYSDS